MRLESWFGEIGFEVSVNRDILKVLFQERRLRSPASGSCFQTPCPKCFQTYKSVLKSFTDKGIPISAVLPAFPAKAPNEKKVLGILPDTAEIIALSHLNELCSRIEQVYAPGMRITICSDGLVFKNCIGIGINSISEYWATLRELGSGLKNLSFFSLDNIYPGSDPNSKIDRLLAEHGESLEEIRMLVKSVGDLRNLFNGIHRFLVEDQASLTPAISRSQIEKTLRTQALEVIRHSRAWGKLIHQVFPHSLRLSIHPQLPHSPKFGIALGFQKRTTWRTPWHGVAVMIRHQTYLMKRSEAEEMGAKLIFQDGRPMHYECN
jgi:L-tyrosine isonitrile synthase